MQDEHRELLIKIEEAQQVLIACKANVKEALLAEQQANALCNTAIAEYNIAILAK